MYKKSVPLPGQLENCEICSKRFTVTPYSKTGPDGGLLCTACGKELAKEASAETKPKKKGPTGRKRRKVESDKLDGKIQMGAKSLAQLCVEKVANHTTDIEDLGDLPDAITARLSEIFTKKRVMKPKTLQLFLRPDLDRISIHDCACASYPFLSCFAKSLLM
jgi:DNA repair protein RAD7